MKNRFLEGIIWNYGSLFILSISGFLFNCIIMQFYDASVLGIFNQAYAWYVVLSQITVMGIHMSVGKSTAEFCKDNEKVKNIVFTAIIETLLISVIVVAILEYILPLVVTENQNLLHSMQAVVLGLVFFSLNKVLLAYLNGISAMKMYAIFQSLRYIFISVFIYCMAALHIEGCYLSFSLGMAEIILMLLICIVLAKKKLIGGRVEKGWIVEHLKFGIKILPANMVLELNAKVDILCLGLVLRDDYLIGIYSFAALFAEGFYQIYVVIRRSINPQITNFYVSDSFIDSVQKLHLKLRKNFRILSPAAVFIVMLGYIAICIVVAKREYIAGAAVLFIIIIAISCNGVKIIFGNIFSQTGMPTCESYINVLTVNSIA